jgi:hypothetical protein
MASTAAISDTLYLFGRDKNADGSFIPGARIKYIFDLIERDLAWHNDIEKTISFQNLIIELRTLFPTL